MLLLLPTKIGMLPHGETCLHGLGPSLDHLIGRKSGWLSALVGRVKLGCSTNNKRQPNSKCKEGRDEQRRIIGDRGKKYIIKRLTD